MQAAETELNGIRAENAATQKQIVSKYESELTELRSELEISRRRAADRDLLYESKIRIENQLVFEERQSRTYREDTQKELLSTKEENHDLRGQLKTRLIELERYERELAVAIDRLEASEVQEKEKVDQIESLQLLWREKQSEFERVEEKNRSLQKLNQQLSVNLNAQRKEIMDLKAQIENERFIAAEKLNALHLNLPKLPK